MAKFKIIGDPIADMLEDMDRIGIDIKPAVNEMLERTQDLIQQNLKENAKVYDAKGGGLKGYATGNMYRTIIDDHNVTWETGTVASVNAGFNLKSGGGIHSIFVMYGTPRMSKDLKVYNAVRGGNIKRRIKILQKSIIQKYLKLGR